ncbi:MAG: right-handed parallel beta-helix repeat-containing protein [Bacteroidota bacterium]
MWKPLCLVAGIVFTMFPAIGQTLYVSTTGNDTNPGTIDSCLKTIPRALSIVQPGSTIYVRGGIYSPDSTIRISKQGTENAPYNLFAYPGEQPVLDFSAMPVASSNRGVSVSGNYWHIRGFVIRRAGDNGMYVSGSFNTVENCSLEGNADTGMQLDNGASNNQIINCDSYDNMDPGQGNADGFAAKLSVGSGNSFYGCRAWQNSDDGWDGYLRLANDVNTTLENCWSFMNGYLANGTQSSGNGNGFKMGGSDAKDLEHNMVLKKCLAFDNRAKGFDQNNNRGSMTLLNCTAYRNGTNYSIILALDSGKTATVTNCVALGMYGSLASFTVQTTNSWMSPFIVTDPDFLSTDTAGVRSPRQPDGSLPDITFLHLANGSDLIDGGTDVGLSFDGKAPDLGAFETDGATDVASSARPSASFDLMQNYPNPFNPLTVISGQLTVDSWVKLLVYDILGRKVATLVDRKLHAGQFSYTFDAHALTSGVYFCRLESGGKVMVRKMTLLK